MKNSPLEFMEATMDWMLIRMHEIFSKPIHLISFTFFVMFLIYTLTSLLPILGEGVIEVKKHMNTDVFRF